MAEWGHRGTLDRLLIGRANSFGFLRLMLALAVVFAHAYALAYAAQDPLGRLSGGQTDFGRLAVVGFFVLSGFMITASGLRLGIVRYAWHRALRIFPGLWACLLVTAFVMAPALYFHMVGSLNGFWTAHGGPLAYIKGWYVTGQTAGFDVSNTMAMAVTRGITKDGGFDGALWSLKYEIFCYMVVGLLAASGALRRAPKLVPLLALGLWSSLAVNFFNAPTMHSVLGEGQGGGFQIPIIGNLNANFVVYLLFSFMLGASAQLYRHRFPVHDGLAILSVIVLLASLHWGAFYVLGYPPFGYLMIWLGVRLPAVLHRVGQKHDYSYGVYIYGFLVEQTLVVLRFQHKGMAVYLPLAVIGSLMVAFVSWHLIERQAMRLKDWQPTFPGGRRRRGAEPPSDRSAPPVAEPALVRADS
ncbi:acyltransferase family protein [Streptacidiphilus sp. EB129]|uniref:acyltransferase family protein n=1 Tax=Streptacidiphilus sp. EB129 TaxID=3156262 RepID=UPI003513C040